MKKGFFLMVLFVMCCVSCSKKEKTNIDKYLTHSDKFEKKKVTDPNGNFSLFIPKDWELESQDVSKSEDILLWNNIISPEERDKKEKDWFNDSFNKIRIIKVKDSLDLKGQYERYINEESYFDDISDSGETKFLNYPSYFTYTYHKENYDRIKVEKREIIRFSLESEQEGVYYHLFLIAIENEHQKQNMSMMLHCLKTFEILNI